MNLSGNRSHDDLEKAEDKGRDDGNTALKYERIILKNHLNNFF